MAVQIGLQSFTPASQSPSLRAPSPFHGPPPLHDKSTGLMMPAPVSSTPQIMFPPPSGPPLRFDMPPPSLSQPPPIRQLNRQLAASSVIVGGPRFELGAGSVGTTTPSTLTGQNAASGSSTAAALAANFDGRRMRSRGSLRRTVDYNVTLVNYIQVSESTVFLNGNTW